MLNGVRGILTAILLLSAPSFASNSCEEHVADTKASLAGWLSEFLPRDKRQSKKLFALANEYFDHHHTDHAQAARIAWDLDRELGKAGSWYPIARKLIAKTLRLHQEILEAGRFEAEKYQALPALRPSWTPPYSFASEQNSTQIDLLNPREFTPEQKLDVRDMFRRTSVHFRRNFKAETPDLEAANHLVDLASLHLEAEGVPHAVIQVVPGRFTIVINPTSEGRIINKLGAALFAKDETFLLFDPIKLGTSEGMYTSRERSFLLIGHAHIFSPDLFDHVLAHEIRHLLTARSLKKGVSTTFQGSLLVKGKGDLPYGKIDLDKGDSLQAGYDQFLSLDEVEAWYRPVPAALYRIDATLKRMRRVLGPENADAVQRLGHFLREIYFNSSEVVSGYVLTRKARKIVQNFLTKFERLNISYGPQTVLSMEGAKDSVWAQARLVIGKKPGVDVLLELPLIGSQGPLDTRNPELLRKRMHELVIGSLEREEYMRSTIRLMDPDLALRIGRPD
jgi:hypothetical protein